MLDESFRGGFVVVGGDEEEGVGADLAGVFGEGDGVVGVVGAGSGDYGDSAGGFFYAEADAFFVLFVGEG